MESANFVAAAATETRQEFGVSAIRTDHATPRNRWALVGVLLGVICLGLASRRYSQELPEVIAVNAGDALWTVAVFLAIAFFFPDWRSIWLGLMAFGVSVVVEFSQLIDLEWLNSFRRTGLGHLMLGSDFVWVDLLRYLLGAAVATWLDWLGVRYRHHVRR